jgi:hypothetical protein
MYLFFSLINDVGGKNNIIGKWKSHYNNNNIKKINNVKKWLEIPSQ